MNEMIFLKNLITNKIYRTFDESNMFKIFKEVNDKNYFTIEDNFNLIPSAWFEPKFHNNFKNNYEILFSFKKGDLITYTDENNIEYNGIIYNIDKFHVTICCKNAKSSTSWETHIIMCKDWDKIKVWYPFTYKLFDKE